MFVLSFLYLKQTLVDVPGSFKIRTTGPGKNQILESPHDVVCCVKRFAADHQLSQETMVLEARN